MSYKIQFIQSIADISCQQWNAIAGIDYPFLRHEFLFALEDCGISHGQTGWQPQHVLIYNNAQDSNQLVGIMPLYIKSHSYGEFIFDHAWADAFFRNGLDYYPKLLTAIPYSPVEGSRIALVDGVLLEDIVDVLNAEIKQLAQSIGASGWHILFPQKTQSQQMNAFLKQRLSVNFHWFNHGFTSFEHYLESFNSRKRKNLRKEREAIAQHNISLEIFEGHEITESLWQRFYAFYQATYYKRSGHGGYFNCEFFQRLGAVMPENLLLVLAKDGNGEYVAGALNFKDSENLYGRYWGCIEEFNQLHFETCYYQGIEYCIKNKLKKFDPGVQGEHKIQRGFKPIFSYSNHVIFEQRFNAAIYDFIDREAQHMQTYLDDATSYLPFKKE